MKTKTTCPYCGYKATDQSDLTKRKDTVPVNGDVAFCIECSGINEFFNGALQKVDIESLPTYIQQKITQLKAAWRSASEEKRHQ